MPRAPSFGQARPPFAGLLALARGLGHRIVLAAEAGGDPRLLGVRGLDRLEPVGLSLSLGADCGQLGFALRRARLAFGQLRLGGCRRVVSARFSSPRRSSFSFAFSPSVAQMDSAALSARI